MTRDPIKCKLRSNWNFGVWLGRDSQDDMHILGTRQGIVKTLCVKRTIPSERYDQQLFLQERQAVRYQRSQSLRATAGTASLLGLVFFRGADGKLRSSYGDDSSYVHRLAGERGYKPHGRRAAECRAGRDR